MNCLKVFLPWCAKLSDVVVSRMAPICLRCIIDLLLVAPPEYVVSCMNTSRQLVRLILVKVFSIEIDPSYSLFLLVRFIRISHYSMEDSGDPEVIAFLEQERKLFSKRRTDFAVTLVDSLFRFYGPASEFARETIESLYQFDPTNQLIKEIKEQVKTHHEFELVRKVVPHIQMRFPCFSFFI